MPARILAHILQRLLQPGNVELAIEDDQVGMRGHDDKGIDAQAFLTMAVVKAFGD